MGLGMLHCTCVVGAMKHAHNADILSSLSGLVVSQPLSQSVGRGFESQGKCWDFSSLINEYIIKQ